jgi:hypothetical protein
MSVPPKIIDPTAPKIVSWCLLQVSDTAAPPLSPCNPCYTFFEAVKLFESQIPSQFASGGIGMKLNLGGQPLSSPGVCIPMITERGVVGGLGGATRAILYPQDLTFTAFGKPGDVQPVSITYLGLEVFSFDITIIEDASLGATPSIDPKAVPLSSVLTMAQPGDTITDVFDPLVGTVQLSDLKEGVTYFSRKLGLTFQLVPNATNWKNAPWVDSVTGHPPPPWVVQAWVYDGPIDTTQSTIFEADLVGGDLAEGPLVFGLDSFFYAAGPLLAGISQYVQIWAGQ